MTREEFKRKFGIIGRSKEINDLVDIVMQVATSDISVLLYGESGVGKEIFAKAIHGYSNRADAEPFLKGYLRVSYLDIRKVLLLVRLKQEKVILN